MQVRIVNRIVPDGKNLLNSKMLPIKKRLRCVFFVQVGVIVRVSLKMIHIFCSKESNPTSRPDKNLKNLFCRNLKLADAKRTCRDHCPAPFSLLCWVKGVSSPIPPYCGYFIPSHFHNIVILGPTIA